MSRDPSNLEDQQNSQVSEKPVSPQKTLKKLGGAGKQGARKDFVDITALVRSIQRAEGNIDCFRKGLANCDRVDCSWYVYCLQSD
jgi:hypothetical protein